MNIFRHSFVRYSSLIVLGSLVLGPLSGSAEYLTNFTNFCVDDHNCNFKVEYENHRQKAVLFMNELQDENSQSSKILELMILHGLAPNDSDLPLYDIFTFRKEGYANKINKAFNGPLFLNLMIHSATNDATLKFRESQKEISNEELKLTELQIELANRINDRKFKSGGELDTLNRKITNLENLIADRTSIIASEKVKLQAIESDVITSIQALGLSISKPTVQVMIRTSGGFEQLRLLIASANYEKILSEIKILAAEINSSTVNNSDTTNKAKSLVGSHALLVRSMYLSISKYISLLDSLTPRLARVSSKTSSLMAQNEHDLIRAENGLAFNGEEQFITGLKNEIELQKTMIELTNRYADKMSNRKAILQEKQVELNDIFKHLTQKLANIELVQDLASEIFITENWYQSIESLLNSNFFDLEIDQGQDAFALTLQALENIDAKITELD